MGVRDVRAGRDDPLGHLGLRGALPPPPLRPHEALLLHLGDDLPPAVRHHAHHLAQRTGEAPRVQAEVTTKSESRGDYIFEDRPPPTKIAAESLAACK